MRTVHALSPAPAEGNGRKRRFPLRRPTRPGFPPRDHTSPIVPRGTDQMANPPVRWHPTLRQQVVSDQASRAVRRMQALTVVDHLEQVAVTLRQNPDVDLYMLAAA